MTTMIRTALVALVAFILGASPLFSSGCATTGAPEPTGPIELDGTKWKMLISAGKIDGRVVEFKKKAKDSYVGTLAEHGLKLRDVVGLHEGYLVFSLRKRGENEYEGMYKEPFDGSEKEVVVFVKGNTMRWNLAAVEWERQY